MRFFYGFFVGVLATVIAAILYLAFAGGEYLLVLSPRYQEMKSSLASLEKAAQQRDQLATKLEDLERRFRDLAERFTEIQPGRAEPTALPSPLPEETPAVP
jgi:hypothetical protein